MIDLKTMDVLVNKINLIKEPENLINGATVEEPERIFFILQTKTGIISVLKLLFSTNLNEIYLEKIKEINAKVIGFLKFSLNQIIFEESNGFGYDKNKIFSESLLIFPDEENNFFNFRKYNEENSFLEVPFSKKNVFLFLLRFLGKFHKVFR